MKSSIQPMVEQTEDPPEGPPMAEMVPSQFIVRLRARFLSQEAHQELWSGDFADINALNRNALIAADIAAAFRSVFMRNEEGEDLAPESGGEGSAANRMKEFLLDESEEGAAAWPDGEPFAVPDPYEHDSFRRYEVGCAAAVLMEAFHRSGPGGGIPTEFPPTKPH